MESLAWLGALALIVLSWIVAAASWLNPAVGLGGRLVTMVNRQTDRLQQEIEALRAEHKVSRHRIARLEILNESLRLWAVSLAEQVVSLGAIPIQRPPLPISTDDGPPHEPPNHEMIFSALCTLFDSGELRILARDIGIDPDSVAGDTAPTYALNLFERAAHLGRYGEMTARVLTLRPRYFAPKTPDA